MNRLMLCAGVHRREGWKTLDQNPEFGADFIARIPPLPAAVKAVSWDEIELIHGITSFYPWEAMDLLAGLHDVIAPAGKLILEQPDFRRAIKVEWVFGDPVPRNPLHLNRWGYTPESLAAAVKQAGFRRIVILPAEHHNPLRDFRIGAFV